MNTALALSLVPLRGRSGHSLRLLSGCLLLALSSSMAFAANDPAANLLFVHGEVKIIDVKNKERPAARGAQLFTKELVRTGSAGSAQVKFTDGTLVALRPGTEYRIDEYKENPNNPNTEKQASTLLKGSLRAITGAVGKRVPANVTFSTPVATMGIRGTVIGLIYVPPEGLPELPDVAPGTYALVTTGRAELTSGGGQFADGGGGCGVCA